VGRAVVAVGVVGVVAAELSAEAAGAGVVGAGVVAVAVGAGVVAGAGAGVVAVWVVVEGVEVPANGSVYCWSPAEPPPPAASVAAGTARTSAASTRIVINKRREACTATSMSTVLVARIGGSLVAKIAAVCPVGGPGNAHRQIAILQDLLQGRTFAAPSDAAVLGWHPLRGARAADTHSEGARMRRPLSLDALACARQAGASTPIVCIHQP